MYRQYGYNCPSSYRGYAATIREYKYNTPGTNQKQVLNKIVHCKTGDLSTNCPTYQKYSNYVSRL